MRLSDFDYQLPPELIAQEPATERDAARLLVLHRRSGRIEHRVFSDLPEYLHPADVLVVNDTKVIPARLFGTYEGGKSVEVLLVRPVDSQCWEALVKPAKPARVGRRLLLACGHLPVTIAALGIYGRRIIRLPADADLRGILRSYGLMPLPPYIKRSAGYPVGGLAPSAEKDRHRLGTRRSDLGTDFERYQTVFAQQEGAVAAPTAGLHFTTGLLDRIRRVGVLVQRVTLHVGPGTFQPVRVQEVSRHRMEPEAYMIPEETVRAVKLAKAAGRRVVAVGTTSVRTLEHAIDEDGRLRAGQGETDLFITPGHTFRVVDVLLTNFHLPRSTLLMLVSAFAGLDLIRRAYAEAIAGRYRFYSYGDAMLIL